MSNDLRRILDMDADPLVKAALASALQDRPSRRSIQRAAAALGVSVAAGALAKVAGAGAVQGSGVAGPVTPVLLLKWFLLGSALGIAGVGTSAVVTSGHADRAPIATPLQTVPKHPESVQHASSADVDPGPEDAPAPAVPATAWATGPHPSVPGRPADSVAVVVDEGLAREVALLDEARNALRAGAPQQALAVLARFDSLPSPRKMGSEALLLKVRALVAAGRRDEARQLVERYVSTTRGNAYERRLRALVPEAGSNR